MTNRIKFKLDLNNVFDAENLENALFTYYFEQSSLWITKIHSDSVFSIKSYQKYTVSIRKQHKLKDPYFENLARCYYCEEDFKNDDVIDFYSTYDREY